MLINIGVRPLILINPVLNLELLLECILSPLTIASIFFFNVITFVKISAMIQQIVGHFENPHKAEANSHKTTQSPATFC